MPLSLETLFHRITRFVFVTGKGGVGKTSLSCALALNLAERGCSVLLVSTDPASNLDEVLETALGPTPTPIAGVPGLQAMNLNPMVAATAYRESVVAPFREVLPSEVLNNIEEQLSGACTVEIAAFNEFAALMDSAEAVGSFDHIIFDTAPSGHTLRLLALPAAWSEFLERPHAHASCLGPLHGLANHKARYDRVLKGLADPKLTLLTLVARPQASALQEAARASEELADLGLKNQCLVINGVLTERSSSDSVAQAMFDQAQTALENMPETLRQLPHWQVRLRAHQILGLQGLRRFFAPEPDAGEDAPDPGRPPASPYEGLEALIDQLVAAGPGLVMTMGKGGVGKTSVAVMVAQGLARRGCRVHLTTTDPANHLLHLAHQKMTGLTVGAVDPATELARYRLEVREAALDLDAQAKALLDEDLSSPCTEEIAVFRGFAREVALAEGHHVVIDTAPTGHTVLLLDAAQAYQREVLRQPGSLDPSVTQLLPRLRDPGYTRILLVTLPESTPVHEAAALQQDLRRAGISVYAWVVNQSLVPQEIQDPLLRARQTQEYPCLREVERLAPALPYLIPWRSDYAFGACLPCGESELTPP